MSGVKSEVTDFNEVYQNQPPDSVVIDGKKETLDLDLTNGSRQVWLVKLPKFLAEKWNDIDKIGGQEIGKLRMKQDSMKQSSGDFRFKLVLNEVPVDERYSSGPEEVKKDFFPGLVGRKKDHFQDLPHEYDLRVTNKAVKNQFVFSEQNLEVFKKEENVDKAQARMKSWQLRQRYMNGEDDTDEPTGKVITYVRTIPKKTAMVGTVCHECSVTPLVTDRNYGKVLKDRKSKISKAPDRPQIGVLKETQGIVQDFIAPSLRGDGNTFIRANRENRHKDGRAIRMDRKELLDLLFKLFDEYDYWTMRTMKERVKQPQSWLKECLDSIATLIKRGPYASKYCLKPEYKKLRDVERAERLEALGLAPKQDDKDEDEDDDIEMENI